MTPVPPRLFALLCAHCFCAVGTLGVFVPFFALFLRESVGLNAGQSGLVLAIPPLVGLIAQPVWGQVADRTGSRVFVLVLIAGGTAVAYLALTGAHDLPSTVLATFVLALFQSALMSTSVSVTLGVVGATASYGRVRVWGTLGYLAIVAGAPAWLDAQRATSADGRVGIERLFFGAAALAVGAALTALPLRRHAGLTSRAQPGDLRALLALPAFRRVLAFSAGIQLFIHGPLQFFPLYVRARGGDVRDLSHMWIWMVLLEVPMIFGSGRLFARFGVARVMTAAAACAGLRWIGCACAPSLAYAYPLQLLHALVVTGLNVGTALHVEQIVPGRLRSTGQALVVMVMVSVGGMLSSTLTGAALDRFGVDPVYFAGGAGALLWAVVWWRPLAAGTEQATPGLTHASSAGSIPHRES